MFDGKCKFLYGHPYDAVKSILACQKCNLFLWISRNNQISDHPMCKQQTHLPISGTVLYFHWKDASKHYR